MRWRAAVIATIVVGGGAAHGALAAAAELPRAEARPSPKPAAAHRPCASPDREFDGWSDRTFGSGYEVFHDGPDPARIRNLVGEPKADAERMLRRGLAACSSLAVSAIARAGWRDLVPDLARAVSADDPEFRARVILPLKTLGDRGDFTDELIAVLSSGSAEARATAALGARHFSIDRLRRPLLDRVRQDPSWLVRVHAAESLYELADIYPRDLDEHPVIAAAVRGAVPSSPSSWGLVAAAPPLAADERARLAVAADQLDAEITARLSAGRCPKPVALTGDDLYVVPVRERPIVTLTVEESVGPCERKLAFVAFVESSGGFSRWLGAGLSGRDPIKLQLQTLPAPVTVGYARATGVLTVGTFTLDTAKANVVVLDVGPGGVAVRYQDKLALTFERHGRAPSSTGMAVVDFQPEIGMAVRALLDRAPELRELVRGTAARGDVARPPPPP
jgi:hypothetical protein